ncbi:MAG: hypothetical protein ABIP75_11740 [Pyrinomonadaceae bacterium]
MLSIEHKLFLFLQDTIGAAAAEDPLHDVELHDSLHQVIKRQRGLRIGECRSLLAPRPDNSLDEFDARLTVIGFARVAGADKTERLAARDAVIELAAAVIRKFLDDPTLGGRVCDLLAGQVDREFASINGEPFALARVPLVINPSGQRLNENDN